MAETGPLLDQIQEGFQIIGFDWRYLVVNAAVARHGRKSKEELLGRTMMEVYPGIEKSEMFRQLERCMTERVSVEMENEFEYADGSKNWFELRIEPVEQGVLIFSLDISRRKKLEVQLRHSQKMEAVARLAAAVAHDFNNLISVVLGYSDFVMEALSEGDPIRDDVTEIRRAGERASGLTRQLLAFGRRQVLEPRLVDLNDVLEGMEEMTKRLIGEDVQLEYVLAPSLPLVLVDPGMMEQVVMNLIVNARDAMPEGGQLTIESRDAVLDSTYVDDHVGVAEGRYVLVAVTDTGCGMDRATAEQIFEPFFTTKPEGEGTGLGLSTAFGIVKQSQGHIAVYSEPGKGTTFKVYLPVADRAAPPWKVSQDLEAPPGGDETILLVEDDDQLRTLAEAILSRGGYHVLVADNAGEALLIAEQREGPLHLLVTDVVLPRLTGVEFAKRLGDARPELRVLYMSGYPDRAITQHGVLDVDAAFVQKPIRQNTLLRIVRALLDDEPVRPQK